MIINGEMTAYNQSSPCTTSIFIFFLSMTVRLEKGYQLHFKLSKIIVSRLETYLDKW